MALALLLFGFSPQPGVDGRWLGMSDAGFSSAALAQAGRERPINWAEQFGKGVAPSSKSVHPPFRKHECLSCHLRERAFAPERPVSVLCVRCHEAFFKDLEQREFLHGPLAVGQCTLCHHPHESPYLKLIQRPQPDLCRTCHGVADMRLNPRHIQTEADSCLRCHNQHGEDRKFLLREDPPPDWYPPFDSLAEGQP